MPVPHNLAPHYHYKNTSREKQHKGRIIKLLMQINKDRLKKERLEKEKERKTKLK